MPIILIEDNIILNKKTNDKLKNKVSIIDSTIDDDDTIKDRDWNSNDYDLSLRTSATYKDNNTMNAIVSLDILESINLMLMLWVI